MKYQQVGDSWVVRLERGEEVVASLLSFCAQEGVRLGSVSGIGAVEDVELGYYDVTAREYSSTHLSGQHEVTGLLGNISEMEGEPYLHMHVTLGDKEFRAWAGHLAKATVSATLEVVIRELPGGVERFTDEETTGLNLWKI